MLYFTVPVSVQPGAPTANPTEQTLLQLVPASDHRVWILGMDIGIAGNNPGTQPLKFEWVTETDNGTNNGTITPTLQDRGLPETLANIVTCKTFNGATSTEPTDNTIITSFALHRQGTLPWAPESPIPVTSDDASMAFIQYDVAAAQGSNLDVYFTVYCAT